MQIDLITLTVYQIIVLKCLYRTSAPEYARDWFVTVQERDEKMSHSSGQCDECRDVGDDAKFARRTFGAFAGASERSLNTVGDTFD